MEILQLFLYELNYTNQSNESFTNKYSTYLLNSLIPVLLLLFNDNKIKMARTPGKTQKKNPVGCTGGDKR